MSQDKLHTLLERLELDLGFIEHAFKQELSELGVFDTSGNWKILDRAIGGGQLVKWCEDEFVTNNISPVGRVYGCEKRRLNVEYALETHDLKGTYIHTGDYMIPPRFDNISFLPDENRTFKYIEIGNYPYNDGSVNDTVIWHKFIAQAKESRADAGAVVVQASFLSQQNKGMSKAVKKDLIALGCYKIVVNDYGDFDETKAKVKTCMPFWSRGYQGLIEFVERKTGHSVKTVLDKPFDMIFDPVHRTFIDEMSAATKAKTERKPKWARLSSADKKKWCIGSYYRTEGFDKNPLKPFVILDPTGDQSKDHYVVFGKADTQVQAEELLKQLNSFWFSDPVQAFMLLTRYQISLDYTQYAKVPKTTVDHVFTNDELYTLWNISDPVKKLVETLVKDCNHKKVKEKDNATDN